MDHLILADVREGLTQLEDSSVDAIVTDPPYELGFMGKSWDASGIANNVGMWAQCLRVLKPGGHLLAFSGSRTYHRMVCAIEDAGFEIRDQIMWLYGSGFPKSRDVSKAIDKAAGATREVIGQGRGRTGKAAQPNGGSSFSDDSYQWPGEYAITAASTDAARLWEGWGTALKPAHEPICVARKPFAGTVAGNVLEHGTGALNIDACRLATTEARPLRESDRRLETNTFSAGLGGSKAAGDTTLGRWPANVIHDGSPEVLEAFPDAKGQQGAITGYEPSAKTGDVFGQFAGRAPAVPRTDTGSAARFFYCAKASKKDRGEQNNHPTVKPTELMAYLVRLVTPPGGTVLDPFMGSGSTGKACAREGFRFIGIDMTAEYVEIARGRIAAERERMKPARQADLFEAIA